MTTEGVLVVAVVAPRRDRWSAVLEEGSRTAAAARLFVHVNTVRQRAERLAELLGSGWDVPPRSLDVHAALRLQVLRTSRGLGWGA